MRELPFGARISDAFVKKLKWDTAKADAESPGVLPCLFIEEGPWQQTLDDDDRKAQAERIDFEKDTDVPPINRLVPHSLSASRTSLKEIFWVLQFNTFKYPPEATFEIDGVELHISKQIQALLQGATIHVVSDKIVVTDGRIRPNVF